MACADWYARDWLIRDAVARGGQLVSDTEIRHRDGTTETVPAHCGHDPLNCPPTPTGRPLAVTA